MKNIIKYTLTGILGGLVALVLYTGLTYSITKTNTQDNSKPITKEISVGENVSIPQLVATAKPSIVQITKVAADPNVKEKSLGSGVIIDSSNGYVITNFHIVATEENFSIHLEDGRIVAAKRLGGNFDKDISVLELEDKTDLKALPIADSSKLQIGQMTIAIGCPLSLNFAHTTSVGVISTLDREVTITNADGESIIPLLQTDANINTDNSGGALLNSSGQLIGLNSVHFSHGEWAGLNFSIPSNTIKLYVEEMIKTLNP